MKLRVQTHISLLVAASGILATCGSRQPVEEKQPPPLFAAEPGACPAVTVGPNRQLTTAIGESKQPVVIWDGAAFGVVWNDLRGRAPEIRYQRVDKDGEPLGSSIRVKVDESALNPSSAWDGETLRLVFTLDGAVAATRGADGAVEVLSPHGQDPVAGPWAAAVWVEAGVMYFRSDGMLPPKTRRGEQPPHDPPVPIAAGGIESPQMAWNGEIIAVVWSDSSPTGRDILMQRITPKGKKLGAPLKISATAGLSRKPAVVWTGRDFAVAWTDSAPADHSGAERYRIFAALVPPLAAAPSLTRQLDFLAAAEEVALASSGKELALAWVGDKKPRGTEIYFRRLSLQGEALGKTATVTDGSQLTAGRPRMAWSGDGYAVVWHDDRAVTGAEVFFSFLACGASEQDTDSIEQPPLDAEQSSDSDSDKVADTDSLPFELKAFD